MRHSFHTVPLLAVALLVGCSENPLTPDDADAALVQPGPSLAPHEQAALDAMGAAAKTEPGLFDCFAFLPFSEDDETVALAVVFPFFGGDCTGFIRTNPDGTQDRHLKGTGSILLLAPEFVGSAGSEADWQVVAHEDGIVVFSLRGTLSDGRRIRIHKVITPTEENRSAGEFFWIEGSGYIVHPGRGR